MWMEYVNVLYPKVTVGTLAKSTSSLFSVIALTSQLVIIFHQTEPAPRAFYLMNFTFGKFLKKHKKRKPKSQIHF